MVEEQIYVKCIRTEYLHEVSAGTCL